MPEPGIVANASARPSCSVAMVGGDPPDAKPFLRVQLGRVAFEVRDSAAYRSCLGAFRQAHHMARDVFLPPGSALQDGRAGRRRQERARRDRAAAATTATLADALDRITEELRAGAHPATALRGVAADAEPAQAVLGPAATAAALGEGVGAAIAAEAARRPEAARPLRQVAGAWSLAEQHGVPECRRSNTRNIIRHASRSLEGRRRLLSSLPPTRCW